MIMYWFLSALFLLIVKTRSLMLYGGMTLCLGQNKIEACVEDRFRNDVCAVLHL